MRGLPTHQGGIETMIKSIQFHKMHKIHKNIKANRTSQKQYRFWFARFDTGTTVARDKITQVLLNERQGRKLHFNLQSGFGNFYYGCSLFQCHINFSVQNKIEIQSLKCPCVACKEDSMAQLNQLCIYREIILCLLVYIVANESCFHTPNPKNSRYESQIDSNVTRAFLLYGGLWMHALSVADYRFTNRPQR